MNVVNEAELKRIKANNGFFDFEKLESGYGFKSVIEFDDPGKSVTYSDIQFGVSGKEVDERAECLKYIVKELLALFGGNGVISKYGEKWVLNRLKSKQLYECIKKQSLSVCFDGGILIPDDCVTMLIVDAILKYNCFALFILENCILAPTDHMDIFLWYTDADKQRKIHDIVNDLKREDLTVRTEQKRYYKGE